MSILVKESKRPIPILGHICDLCHSNYTFDMISGRYICSECIDFLEQEYRTTVLQKANAEYRTFQEFVDDFLENVKG